MVTRKMFNVGKQLKSFMLCMKLYMYYRLHGNVKSVGVLSSGAEERTGGRIRDSIILTFQDAKISVLEFDDLVYGLCTR